MVEFMITAPFLLLLLLAISEFGHALYQYNALTKSVRDGGRHLSEIAFKGITGSIVMSPEEISETQNLVVYGNEGGNGNPLLPGLDPSQITVSCLGGGTSCPGVEHVVVSAQYPYQSILGASLPLFGYGGDVSLGLTLNTSVTMRAI
jgi:hypothetical protein